MSESLQDSHVSVRDSVARHGSNLAPVLILSRITGLVCTASLGAARESTAGKQRDR